MSVKLDDEESFTSMIKGGYGREEDIGDVVEESNRLDDKP